MTHDAHPTIIAHLAPVIARLDRAIQTDGAPTLNAPVKPGHDELRGHS